MRIPKWDIGVISGILLPTGKMEKIWKFVLKVRDFWLQRPPLPWDSGLRLGTVTFPSVPGFAQLRSQILREFHVESFAMGRAPCCHLLGCRWAAL